MIKTEFLILSVLSSDISNFSNFDSNTTISFDALCFSYLKSVNNLKILIPSSNKHYVFHILNQLII